MTLENKRIVVIGGSSGIGLATAKACLQAGAKVVIASRSNNKLKQANESLNNEASCHAVDLLDNQSIEQLFVHTGNFDHLQIPASEVMFGDLDSLSEQDARRSFDSKFWGVYNAILAARQYLNKNSSITLYSGAASQRPNNHSVMLGALNGAVEHLSKGLAIALAPIRVNVISPGITMTPLFENLGQDIIDDTLKTYAPNMIVKRYATADEIAEAALFLMNNAFTTGSKIQIDGGLSIK